MNLPLAVFGILTVLVFFGVSISAVAIWIKSFQKTKEIMKDPNKHWSFKAFVMYGAYFTYFMVAAVFISLVVCLALIIVGY